MIFSKFFKEKWQHKDANVRLSAIDQELSNSNSEQREILIDLLNNDTNENVRRAALIKLQDFDVWQSAALQNNMKTITAFASKQIAKMLRGQHDLKLDDDTRLKHIENMKSAHGLEGWLTEESNPAIVIALYKKIAKPQLSLSTFTQKKHADVQAFLVEQTEDVSLLEKMLKKANTESIANAIAEKLAKLNEIVEKPIRLKKDIQLILSKYLALKDTSDYKSMRSKQTMLQEQWSDVLEQFDCLSEEEQQAFTAKYKKISEQIKQLFAAKAEAYQQQVIADNLAQEKAKVQSRIEEMLAAISQTLTTAIFENNDIDDASYQEQLTLLKGQVHDSVLDNAIQQSLTKRINEQVSKLNRLPEIAQSVSDATHLISKISQLALPSKLSELNEKHRQYKLWLADWKNVEKKSLGVLPTSITDAYREIEQQWKKGLASLIQQQKSQFFATQKKLRELSALIEKGKFNVAFGVFKKIERFYVDLDEGQQARLQREYQAASEKISELSDWEHYIATPRKQSLLEEVNAIVSAPLDNPNEQANKVKAFRKQWNLLGHADDDIDRELNKAFNLACEEAFAPCREYYQQQDKIRQQHFSIRTDIISEAKAFAESLQEQAADFKLIENELNKLQQKWQSAGEVDRAKYKELNGQFLSVLKPIKLKISQYHQKNTEQKQLLINKASKLIEDDVFDAVQSVKQLQTQWREIGYSGAKEENKLWHAFRAINDQIFSKRDEAKNEQQSKVKALESQFLDDLTEIKDLVSNSKSLADYGNAQDKLSALKDKVFANKPVLKSILEKITNIEKSTEKSITEMRNTKANDEWLQLFKYIELLCENERPQASVLEDCFNELSNFWQKKVASIALKPQANRERYTLDLEIFAGVESPQEFKQARLARQVELMQQQMQSAQQVDMRACFVEWLQDGEFTAVDTPFAARVKPIFCQ